MKQIKFSLLLLSLLLSVSSMIAQEDGEQQIAQWAFRAEATSQYTDDSWSAARATGEPNVFTCADDADAWASRAPDSQEALTVYFREAVRPTQVNIYQSYNPGSITGIAVIPSDGGDPIDVPRSTDPGGVGCPAIFSVTLPGDLPLTNGVVIYLDQSDIGNWNEIDAVELVGTVDGDPDNSQASSIETNAYPDYAFISNTGETSVPAGESTQPETSADYEGAWGRDVNCREGGQIEGGVELTIVQQRTGNQYRVTAIGVDGFDPVLAVTLTGEYDNALCNDDDPAAAEYGANLPTTGAVIPSSTSSQVIFNLNSANAFEDVSIVVGGFGGSSGQFLLIVEGMFAGETDGAGDPFSLAVTPSLYESGITPTAYMIAVTGAFDPLMYLSDADYNPLEEDDGSVKACDDAGNNNLCWGEHTSLSGTFVSRSQGRQLPGGSLDAMIRAPLVRDDLGFFVNYIMRGNNSFGDYVTAFHMGVQAQP